MPLPIPGAGQSHEEFISSCMSNAHMMEKFPDHAQRLAVCFAQGKKGDNQEAFTKDFQTELKDVDGKKGIVSGYFASFDSLDSDGDVIKKGAFSRTINDNGPQSIKPRIKHLFNHNTDQPLGVLLTLKEDQTGLVYESKIGTHSLGQDFIKMAESGLITEHSIGYRTIRKNQLSEDYKEGQPMRELLELRLYEGSSLSAWGANENTPLLGIKSYDAALERSKRIEKFCMETDATDSTIEALLLYNKELLQTIATTQPADAIVPEQEVVEEEQQTTEQLKILPDVVLCPSCNKHTYNTQQEKGYIKCHRCEAVFNYGSKLFIKL